MKILEILQELLKEVEKDNPFNLVLKGGTALSLYYLDHHRESEDLDFDTEKHFLKDYKRIEEYLINILNKLKKDEKIADYKITKSGFASTERYHIKLEIKTYKIFYSKIDIDFVDLPNNLIKTGKLNLYSKERLFINKLFTFVSRKEFKDLYDIKHLAEQIDVKQFKGKENLIQLIQDAVRMIQQEDIQEMFKLAFRNIDLKFKNLKEAQLEQFTEEIINKLEKTVNKLKR